MKTNSVTELLKAKGIGGTLNKQSGPSPHVNSQTTQKRKRLYESPSPEGSILSAESLQRVSRESLEIDKSEPKEVPTSTDFSRESPIINRESLQRVSRESLEKKCVDLTRIVGLQRQVLFIVFSVLQSNGVRVSPPIAISLIAERANTTIANTQNAIKELIKKGVLIRKDFQRGRGGWTIYELEEAVYSKLDSEKTRESLESLQRFSSRQTDVKSRETSSSSSRDLNISNKTTTEPLDLGWMETINVDALQSVGVTRSVLIRCRELYPMITPEGLEDLVSRFSIFIKDPKNKIQNARGFFINLAKQLSEGITPLDHIETPNDRLMRELAQKAREKKDRQAVFEKEVLEFEFESWLEKTPPSEQIELVPEGPNVKQGSGLHRLELKDFFSKKIWPEKKSQILDNKFLATAAVAFMANEKN
jgi:predicted transcriptional regulator